MYFQLKQIRRDCHRLLTEYSTKSHSRPLILTATGTWQVLFWAGLLITYTCIFSTNNIQVAKHQTLSPSNSRCWWASCNFHNHKSFTSYPYIPFKIWQASQFPSLSGSKDSLPNRSKSLHPNQLTHQPSTSLNQTWNIDFPILNQQIYVDNHLIRRLHQCRKAIGCRARGDHGSDRGALVFVRDIIGWYEFAYEDISIHIYIYTWHINYFVIFC